MSGLVGGHWRFGTLQQPHFFPHNKLSFPKKKKKKEVANTFIKGADGTAHSYKFSWSKWSPTLFIASDAPKSSGMCGLNK